MVKQLSGGGVLKRDRKVSFFFVVPALIAIGVFIIYPFVYSLILSLSSVNLMTMALSYVGLDNYRQLFASKAFLHTLSITLQFALIIVGFSTLLGLLFALLLNQKFVGRGFGRGILILPWAVPWVIIGIMWSWMLHSQFGSLNGLLYQLGLIESYIPFLAQGRSALLSTALSAVWRQASFSAILLLASIQTVPNELYESATLDGAHTFHKFRYITMPWLIPTMMVVLIINTLYGFMQFDTVFMMTKGGPGDATEIIAVHMYRRAFEHLRLGQGAAIGYILSLLCLGFGLFFVGILNRHEKTVNQ